MNAVAIEVARASPPCLSGNMRATLKTVFIMSAATPTLTGVVVS